MTFVELAASHQIVEGVPLSFRFGQSHVLICRIEGRVYAINGVCPHRGALLIQGEMNGCTVSCPWHFWEFDVRNGEGVTNPFASVDSYKVEERDGKVWVELDEALLADSDRTPTESTDA